MGKAEEKVTKAVVEGLEETTKEEAEESLLDKIIKITDMALDKEVRGDALGSYDKSGMYNLPFYTSEDKGGKKSWKECDMMPNGCEMKKENKPHTHQVDVGIRGAEYAFQAYGNIHIEQKKPVIDEIDGVKMWVSEMTFTDIVKNLKFNDFVMYPVMKKTYKGVIFDEYGYANAISRCMRKGILRLIPGALRAKWIKAYRDGDENPFTKESVREFQKEREKEVSEQEKDNPPASTEPLTKDNAELDNMALLNDWLLVIQSAEDMDKLKIWYLENKEAIGKHPAKKQINDAVNAKKAELSKPKVEPEQEVLFPEPPTTE